MKLCRSVLLGALLLFFGVTTSAQAQLTLTAGSNATTTPNVATSITGFQIVGSAASTTPVRLRTTHGSLSLVAVSGVTMSGNNTGTVQLSGTVEKLNTALSTLKYTRGSIGTDTLEVALVSAGEIFFTNNNHLYEFVSGGFSWSAAKAAAENRSKYGASGYLATITSAAENDFVSDRLAGDGWIGASDSETEGTWKWVTGPEAGTVFWIGTGGGSAQNGMYEAWAGSEPNQSGDEDCAETYVSSGTWNDYPCTASLGYVVEYGAPDALPSVTAQNISIVTADVPALTSLSPANGSTTVSTTANLVLGFSKSVSGDSGSITIRKSSDDSITESIDVTSELISGEGTGTITINPSSTLEEGTQYYVLVPATAFEDASGNNFAGVLEDTTWSFTTGDFTAPSLSNIAATTSTSSATVTWSTNEAASTRLAYGPTASYTTTTTFTNTSPRVTSHSRTLGSLPACATYHYAVVSEDGFGNVATSSDNTFVTTGCEAAASPESATSTAVTVASGGSTSHQAGNSGITVTAPSNFTATSSSVVIQIHALSNTDILASIGRPSDVPEEVGSIIFDVKAIIDSTTVLDSFDAPITIEYEYTDDEIAGLDESSLWLYHYHDDAWEPLESCTVNTNANTVSCTTESFSLFGLFARASVSSGLSKTGTSVGCKDPSALNYDRFVSHRQSLCRYAPAVIDVETPRVGFMRDLTLGSVGEDVRLLQQMLNAEGFVVAEAGAGSVGNETDTFGALTQAALARYQAAHQVTPAVGYFGPLTRAALGKPITENVSVQAPAPSANTLRDLEVGNSGADVKALQIFLIASSFSLPSGATGYFGSETRAAVATLQKELNVSPQSGYFGSMTRKAIEESEAYDAWW